jgi:glycosyltransferase involved in cell wall biosynthesis
MKILHTIHSASLQGGGVIQAILEIATALKELGIDSEIASLDPPSDNNEIKGFPLYQLGQKPSSYGYSPQFSKWLKTNHHQYDAVIIHGIWQFHSIATYNALRNSSTPYYVYPHGMLDPWFAKTYPRKHLKKLIYWKFFENKVFRYAKGTCFTCEEERILSQKSFSPFSITPHITGLGIADPSREIGVHGEEIFDAIPSLRDKPYLIYLSRLHEKKGIDLLIQAFLDLKSNEEFPKNLQLAIIGPSESPEYENKLKELVQKYGEPWAQSIHFHGMVKGTIKWSALSNAQAMILPSHQENFGIIVAEALALGKPVLISNKVNIWREIQKTEAGFVENDDLAGTKRLLTSWQQCKAKESLQKNAHSCFNKYFLSSQTAKNLQDILTKNS